MNTEEAEQELSNINDMPYGVARSDRVEALILEIEAGEPLEILSNAYLELIESYSFSAESDKAFQALSRTLRFFDERPELWGDYSRSLLFWEFKWVGHDLSRWPQISKKQALAILDDMERRYDLEGAGRSAVESCRFSYACDIGDPRADEYRLRWLATPRDEYSECEACEPGEQANFFWQFGRLEELVAMEPKLHGICNLEPSYGLSFVALAQLLLGQPEESSKSLRKSMRTLTYEHPFEASSSRGRHVQALLLGHRVDEALALLRTRDAILLEGTENPLERLQFLISLVSGLSANREQADLLTGIDRWPTVGPLTVFVDAQAAELAERFDVRNENTFYADALEQARAARLAPKSLPEPPASQPISEVQAEGSNVNESELMEQMVADSTTLSGLTQDRVVAALDALEIKYIMDDDGDLVTVWENGLIWLTVVGSKEQILYIKARWKAWLPAEKKTDALVVANDWNDKRYFPRVIQSPDKDGDIFFFADSASDLEFGITDAQLSAQVDVAIRTSLQFFEYAAERFPGALEAAKAYCEQQKKD